MSATALARRDDQIETLKSRLRANRDRLKTEGQNMLRTVGALGTGYALGMAEAKWGGQAVAGMDTALAVGVAGSAAALFGVGGEAVTTAARTVGDAALAVYSYKKGFEHQQAREEDAASQG